MDFGLRLKRAGGRILLVPDIVSQYHARSSFKTFYQHSFLNGIWVAYPLRFGRRAFSWRHLVPLAFVLALIGSLALSILAPMFWLVFVAVLGSYSLPNLLFCTIIAVEQKDVRFLFTIPAVFATLHVCYGLGSLWGLLKVLGPRIQEAPSTAR